MIYNPSKRKDGGARAFWDPSVIWHDGMYYMFAMFSRKDNWDTVGDFCWDSVGMAVSEDAVHWGEMTPVIFDDVRVYKMFVGKFGDGFVMNQGSFTGDKQNRLKLYESTDLTHWTHIGDSIADSRWYDPDGRWDHMYVTANGANDGYIGVVVANPTNGHGWGLQESKDGVHWEALPPPLIEWGDVPPFNFETGGIERIGDKYYVIGGTNAHMGNWGYSMYTFIADSPTGSFRPDTAAYRLSGSTGKNGYPWGIAFLAAWARCHDEILISNYACFDGGVWLLPLRKPVVDNAGHLRLGYWNGNEAAKDEIVDLDLSKTALVYPAEDSEAATDAVIETSLDRVVVYPEKVPQHCGDNFVTDSRALAVLDQQLDLHQGIILEGFFTVSHDRWIRPAYAGFYIEEDAASGRAILLQVGQESWRTSEIGNLSPGNDFAFDPLDITGPRCATVTGISPNTRHSFRLWIRRNIFELYVDDLLMQTFFARQTTGRIGFIAQNGTVVFENLRAWGTSL